MTSQEYTKWLEGFLEVLSHVRLDHKEHAIALSKIEDKLKDVVDYKFTVDYTTTGTLFPTNTNNTNMTI